MTRYPALLSFVAICLAGCCSSPPQAQHFVPASTVARVEPQPTTRLAYRDAERQGYLIAATGRGVALGLWDQPVQMHEGEALHVLSVDPDSGEALVRRLDDCTLARLGPEGLEVETTTYGR